MAAYLFNAKVEIKEKFWRNLKLWKFWSTEQGMISSSLEEAKKLTDHDIFDLGLEG